MMPDARHEHGHDHGQEDSHGPLRIGIGGPVGTGKTTLVASLCRSLRDDFSIAVVTNDIYTREDADALVRLQALSGERIVGVETGGCPHTAIREDASINLRAIAGLNQRLPGLDIIFIESGGDNLAATFSPELADLTLYVISVCQGDDIPRKGGPAITRSDLLIINKTDLAPHVDADLDLMRNDAVAIRKGRTTLFTDLRGGTGISDVVAFLVDAGGLDQRRLAQAKTPSRIPSTTPDNMVSTHSSTSILPLSDRLLPVGSASN